MNRSRLFRILFPPEPRDFPFRRTVRALLRALHILTAGTLLGGHIFAQPDVVLTPWLVGAVLTGALLFLTDLHASASVMFETRGFAMLAKLVLVGLVAFYPDAAVALLVIALLIGSVASHLPKRYRHKLVFLEEQIVTDRRSG